MYTVNLAALQSGHTGYVRLSTKTATSRGPEAAQHAWYEGQSQTVVAPLGLRQIWHMKRNAIHRTLLLAFPLRADERSSRLCNRCQISSKKQRAEGRPVPEPLWHDHSRGSRRPRREAKKRSIHCCPNDDTPRRTHESKTHTRRPHRNQQLSAFGTPCSSRRTKG